MTSRQVPSRAVNRRAKYMAASLTALAGLAAVAGCASSSSSTASASSASSSSASSPVSLSSVTLNIGDQKGTGAEAVLRRRAC